jgi:hypothetical protein
MKIIAFSLSTAAIAAGFNIQHEVTADTAYAEYIVGDVSTDRPAKPARLLGEQIDGFADRR